MKITLSMKVDDVIEVFEKEFGVVLKINKIFGSETTLLEISNARSKNIFLNVTKDTKVSALESMFENHFGIPLQVRDSFMHTINNDLRLGDILELSATKIDTNIATPDRAEPDIVEENSSEHSKSPITTKTEIRIPQSEDSKDSYTTSVNNNDHVSELISKIDKSYMVFQEKEKYEYMLSLLSVIEEANLTYPDNTRLMKHIVEIKTKAYSIATIAFKKQKFSLIIFSLFTAIILLIGLSILCFDIYNHLQGLKKIEYISREINSLNSSKRKALENKNNEEALAIDKMIEDSGKMADNIENKLNKNKINLFLPSSLLFLVIIAIFFTKAEKYYITSTRFYK